MALPTLPGSRVARQRRRLVHIRATTESPFDGTVQVQDWSRSYWEYDLQFTATVGRQAREISAALTAIGKAGTFLFVDRAAPPSAPSADPGYGPTISTNPVPAGTTAIRFSGWVGVPAGTTGVGDVFSIGSGDDRELHQITKFADVAGTPGSVDMEFVPGLRKDRATGDAIEFAAPTIALRLMEDPPTELGRADSHQFSLKAREVL